VGWVGLDLYVCGLGWVVGYEIGPMDNSALATEKRLQQKIDDTGIVNRQLGSGRKRKVTTEQK